MAGSWNRVNHFIIEADQMTHPIHWNPMEDKWKAWVNKNQVYNGTSHFDPKTLDAMRKLHDRILTFGGDEVCMTAFDEDALGIEVNDGETTIKAQSYPKWDYSNGNPPIDICVAAKSDEMQVGSLMMPTLNVPAPFICLYDEQGEDETEWYAGASLAPRKEGDESPHVVFVDSNYGKVAPETDIFENGSEICTLSCPTSKSLFDFKVAAAQE